MNVIGTKWVFDVKYKADNTVKRLKAWLVAKGFNWQEGVDYFETFSTIVKPPTVWLVLSLAVVKC